jgi:hypothetical protein
MNPGVIATVLAIVGVILLLTDWGKSLCGEIGISPKAFGILLLAFLFATTKDVDTRFGSFNLGGMLFLLFVTTVSMYKAKRLTHSIYILSCVCTVASVELILMTLVPYDPAMFLVDGKILYPFVACLISVIFMRSQLAAVTGGVAGIFTASLLYPVIHFQMSAMQIVWADGDTRDLMASAALGSVLLHYFLRTAFQFVRTRIMNSKESYERGTS